MGMTLTRNGIVCAHAYAAAYGYHMTLNNLLDLLETEQENEQGLIDLGSGCFIRKADTRASLKELSETHSGFASFREVMEDEFGPVVDLSDDDEDFDDEDDLDDEDDDEDLDDEDDEDEDDDLDDDWEEVDDEDDEDLDDDDDDDDDDWDDDEDEDEE
jgi:hypothetical protein